MTKQFTSLLLILLFFTSATSAQSRLIDREVLRRSIFSGFKTEALEERVVMDTLVPNGFLDDCSLNLVVYGITDYWGTISGMSEFEDLEKAQLIENTTNTAVKITDVLAFFDYVNVVGNGNLRAKIYGVSGDGSPADLLGQSEEITADQIMADPVDVLTTRFTFFNPVALSDPSFFVSIDFSDLYASQDSTGLLQTEISCGSGAEAYELWADESWNSLQEIWSTDTEVFDVNIAVFAVVEFEETNAVKDPFYQQGHIRLRPANPNPAGETIRINYELEKPGRVQLEIFSPDGRRMESRQFGQLPNGNYSEIVDLSTFTPGAYIYSILSDEARVVSRFVVK